VSFHDCTRFQLLILRIFHQIILQKRCRVNRQRYVSWTGGGRGLAATVETATESPAVIQPTDDSDWRDGSARQQVADAVASVS